MGCYCSAAWSNQSACSVTVTVTVTIPNVILLVTAICGAWIVFFGVDWVGFWRYIDPSDQNEPCYPKYEIKATDFFGEQSPKFNIWMRLNDYVNILWSYLIWAFEYFLVKPWSAFNRLPLARWHRLALIWDEWWGEWRRNSFCQQNYSISKSRQIG